MNLLTVKDARSILHRINAADQRLRVGSRIFIAAPIPHQSWVLEKRPDGLVQLGRLQGDLSIDWHTPITPEVR
jgi:hypothetical protein